MLRCRALHSAFALLTQKVLFHVVKLSLHKQVMHCRDMCSANRSSEVMDGKIFYLSIFSVK